MSLPEEIRTGTAAELEDWLLGAMDGEPLPAEDMLEVVGLIADSGDRERADGSAELLQDALVDRKDVQSVIGLLKLRSRWSSSDAGFGAVCRKALDDAFSNRLGQSFIKAAGFGEGMHVVESLRRIHVLSSLSDGTQCHEKTWGFGVVRRIDDFYEKVTIDFDGKRGHQMSFSYAAETLEIVDESHILARRHNDPEGLAELVASSPGEVVRMALKSYGELNAVELQEKLVDGIVSEAQWKKFWDGARKQLKNDPLVEVPTRRKEPIRLLDRQKEYDADWFASLKKVRDPDEIFRLLGELEQSAGADALQGDQQEVLADRLALCIKAGQGSRENVTALAVMAASRLGLSQDQLEVGPATERLMRPDCFLGATAGLPARAVRPFMEYCSAHSLDATADLLIDALPDMQQNVLNEALDHLSSAGRDEDCRARFDPLLTKRAAGPEILYWICRHLESLADWVHAGPPELMIQVVDCIEGNYSGERLKARNQLRALFENKDWLQGLLDQLAADQQAEILRRVNGSRGWDTSSKRSVLARIIRMYPELESALAGADQFEDEPKRCPQTSWRSYKTRQEQYRKLTEEEIPMNSREIAAARSYGDLRENFEYQAAKDQQRLLLRRQSEMERDLQDVRGTDFAGAPMNTAGQGTIVTVESSSGVSRQYCVLGEWDQDDDLGIVSSSSRVAQLLEGHRGGDTIPLPGAGAEDEQCTITGISGLSDEVKQWIMG
ncbi:hypothetical protein ACFLQU_02945 [Verrucomicrobiota bacterium]